MLLDVLTASEIDQALSVLTKLSHCSPDFSFNQTLVLNPQHLEKTIEFPFEDTPSNA